MQTPAAPSLAPVPLGLIGRAFGVGLLVLFGPLCIAAVIAALSWLREMLFPSEGIFIIHDGLIVHRGLFMPLEQIFDAGLQAGVLVVLSTIGAWLITRPLAPTRAQVEPGASP